MQRKAWLAGDQFDLESLERSLSHGDNIIQRDGNNYYLTSLKIDAATGDVQANEIAVKLIDRINALARIHDPNFRPVTLCRYTDDTGQARVFGTIGVTLVAVRTQASAIVTHADGTTPPSPPSPWPDYLTIATNNLIVSEALEVISRTGTLGWNDLWKLFEILREAVKPDTFTALGWTTAADLASFKESANHPDVSGEEARHARRPGQPQHRQMPLVEGRSYISDLVAKWLDSLK